MMMNDCFRIHTQAKSPYTFTDLMLPPKKCRARNSPFAHVLYVTLRAFLSSPDTR